MPCILVMHQRIVRFSQSIYGHYSCIHVPTNAPEIRKGLTLRPRQTRRDDGTIGKGRTSPPVRLAAAPRLRTHSGSPAGEAPSHASRPTSGSPSVAHANELAGPAAPADRSIVAALNRTNCRQLFPVPAGGTAVDPLEHVQRNHQAQADRQGEHQIRHRSLWPAPEHPDDQPMPPATPAGSPPPLVASCRFRCMRPTPRPGIFRFYGPSRSCANGVPFRLPSCRELRALTTTKLCRKWLAQAPRHAGQVASIQRHWMRSKMRSTARSRAFR